MCKRLTCLLNPKFTDVVSNRAAMKFPEFTRQVDRVNADCGCNLRESQMI